MTVNLSPRAEQGIALQQRAADPVRSVWVAASAGSGKTRVLVDRTLRLMLAGTRPERILCITFTKAAAAEMANRLNTTLGTWSVMDDAALAGALQNLMGRPATDSETGIARRLFAHVLDAPGGLKIQTIHSFCESVLGRFPIEAAVSPNFEVMDERTASEIMEQVRDMVLRTSQAAGKDVLRQALTVISGEVNEQDFSSLMQGLSSRRGRLRRLMMGAGGLDGALAVLAEKIGIDPAVSEEDILRTACDEDTFDGPRLREALSVLLEGSANDRKAAARMEDWLRLPERRADLFELYQTAFFTTTGAVRSPKTLATAKTVAKMPDIIDVMLAEAERLLQVQERRNRVRVYRSTAALITLGRELIEGYETEKRRLGKLDYDDLILKTRDLLTAATVAPWVMFKLDGGIDHILVDEAQDTSPEQWEVVGALAEEFFAGEGAGPDSRTIFVVGDEKQSIYSFQGADPAAFDKMRRYFEEKARFAGKPWEIVPLDLSFRSTQAVLGLVDDVFQPVSARTGLTAGADEISHFIFREGQAGFTEIWPTVKHPAQEESDPWDVPEDQELNAKPDAQLAQNIAVQIGTWLKDGERLGSTGRKIRPKDIMILVQSRNSFFLSMVRALKQAGIPVAGADRMVLTEQLAVLDLMALARFALLPEDDLNLAVVLKGPFVGCDDNQLFDLAYQRDGSLWRALRENRPGLALFSEAEAFLNGLLRQADFVPVYEFFADILGRCRGREKILGRLGEEAAEPIDEFLSLALGYQRGEATSLQAFLHWVEAGAAEVKRDMEQGRDEVRVLTVHGSKGLQAPIVFLPDTCQSSRSSSNTSIFWTEDEMAVPLWPVRTAHDDALSAAARERVRDRQAEEKKRLLYVALTRAEDRLYICGWEGKQRRASGCWYDLIDDAFSADYADTVDEIALPWGDVARRRSFGIPKEPDEETDGQGPEGEAVPVPDWVRRPPAAEPFPPEPLTPSREEEEPAVRSPLGQDDGRRFHRGILIHRLLESLPSVAVQDREQVARTWLARPAHNLDAAAQAQILSETLAVLEHPEFAGIFGPEGMAEVPLTGLLGSQIMSGQIDRLLIREKDILIVDYKTNRPSPTRVEDVPSVYLRQMNIYRRALMGMYPDKAVKCALLWTDGPHLMILPED
ncbi:double-strand break repair helicase AddA [Sneathiella chinensis]|uniref:DNA 3'-5' helicase n=1 Tax=Sneathiella chinensis TaxID=349750 RepID=A0ABQ5U0C5_9PROT|nr:double-strand break repair helicase AddA [Sneathiella chinensis]GLQ04866.1 double-strand break repair helicase AddA [Sneathiella chinensis]